MLLSMKYPATVGLHKKNNGSKRKSTTMHATQQPLRRLLELATGAEKQRRLKYNTLASELLKLVVTGRSSSSDSGSNSSRPVTQKCIDDLVAELVSADKLPFEEKLLAGGPWLVLHTQGSPQLWKATYKAGKLINAANAASQDLNPRNRTVINRAEYFGKQLYVSASGSYLPLDSSAICPKRIQASIDSGMIHLLGFNVPLPIKGTGEFEVVYLDDRIRIFRSGQAVSVQVKQSFLVDQGWL